MTEAVLMQLISDYGLNGLVLWGMWHMLKRNDQLHKDHNVQLVMMTAEFRSDLENERNSHQLGMRELMDHYKQFTNEVTMSLGSMSNEIRLMRQDIDKMNALRGYPQQTQPDQTNQ